MASLSVKLILPFWPICILCFPDTSKHAPLIERLTILKTSSPRAGELSWDVPSNSVVLRRCRRNSSSNLKVCPHLHFTFNTCFRLRNCLTDAVFAEQQLGQTIVVILSSLTKEVCVRELCSMLDYGGIIFLC